MNLQIEELPNGLKESFGPCRRYLLTRGMVLVFDREGAVVSDGVGSSASFPAGCDPNEYGLFTPKTYARLVDEVQLEIGVRFVGFQGDSFAEAAFKFDEHAISGGGLAEGLLSRLLALERLVQSRVLGVSGITQDELTVSLNLVAALDDNISYGRFDPDMLEKAIDSLKNLGNPVEQAFFAFNATSIAEDMRQVFMAACHHFSSLNSGIHAINQQGPIRALVEEPTDEPWEIRQSSGPVDELSYAYTSSVVASYTVLDLLYILFIYLTREPFLNPEFPSNLHFPDSAGRGIFRYGGAALPSDPLQTELPYAIANLSPGQFAALRKTRNALVHNMAADSFIPRVYKGWKRPPVNNYPLQYVQYMARDVDAQGDPVTHRWVRRFYENQSDAQESLLEWLELTFQCMFDTTEWLIKRWSYHVQTP